MVHLGKSFFGIFEIMNNYGTSWKINILESHSKFPGGPLQRGHLAVKNFLNPAYWLLCFLIFPFCASLFPIFLMLHLGFSHPFIPACLMLYHFVSCIRNCLAAGIGTTDSQNDHHPAIRHQPLIPLGSHQKSSQAIFKHFLTILE